MKRAELVLHTKHVDDALITEVRIWRLPEPSPERPHGFKYSLHCCRLNGELVVRFDNETGKGDHYHDASGEKPYNFHSLAGLIEDFRAAIRRHTA